MPEVEIPNPEHAHHTAADPFSLRVALVVAGYAVLLALATYLLHGAEHEVLMDQQEITNKYNFYQAKAVREAIYGVEVDKLDIELERIDLAIDPRVRSRELRDRLKKKVDVYQHEKKDIRDEAKHLEEKRERMERKSPYYGFAEILLQIAIVLASVSILSKNVAVFWVSVGAAGLAMLLVFNGMFLLMPIPGLG